ncbi:MAG: hypothetical protein VB997_10885, partial [Opitutales bacterium]
IWSVKVMFNGKQVKRSLGTSDKREAERKARQIVNEILAAEADPNALENTKTVKSYSTLGEVVEFYLVKAEERRLSGGKIAQKTAEQNGRLLLEIFGGPEVSLTAVTEEAVKAWALKKLRGLPQGIELTRRQTSCLSMFTQARSVFAAWALKEYAFAGILIPTSVHKFRKSKPVAVKPTKYRVPRTHPKLVEETMAAGSRLKGAMGLAWVLCFEFGLRVSEAANLQWHWFVTAEGSDGAETIMLDVIERPGEFKPKGIDHSITIHPDTFAKLKALATEFTGEDFSGHVLPGTKTARLNLLSRELAAWMRSVGWSSSEFKKCAHELRKLAGSRWYSEPLLGPAVAQEWLGHADVSTTCKFYAALARPVKPLAPV